MVFKNFKVCISCKGNTRIPEGNDCPHILQNSGESACFSIQKRVIIRNIFMYISESLGYLTLIEGKLIMAVSLQIMKLTKPSMWVHGSSPQQEHA